MNLLRFSPALSKTINILLLIFVLFLLFPLYSLAAASYVPLVGIPGVSTSGGGNLAQYFNRLYLLTISIGAIIAVVKIFIAGVKWSMSDVVTDKSSAKSDIRGALLGLAILLVPFVVLNEIYPGLTNLNFLRNAPTVQLTPNPTASSGSTRGLADTNPNSTVSPAGMTYQNCSYARTQLFTATDEFSAATAEYVYDDSACRASCTEKQGTFLPLGVDAGRCSFKADVASNNTVDLEAADPNRMQ